MIVQKIYSVSAQVATSFFSSAITVFITFWDPWTHRAQTRVHLIIIMKCLLTKKFFWIVLEQIFFLSKIRICTWIRIWIQIRPKFWIRIQIQCIWNFGSTPLEQKHHLHYHAERGDPSEVGLRHPDGLLANLCWKIRDGHKPDGENYNNKLFLCKNKDMYCTLMYSLNKNKFFYVRIKIYSNYVISELVS